MYATAQKFTTLLSPTKSTLIFHTVSTLPIGKQNQMVSEVPERGHKPPKRLYLPIKKTHCPFVELSSNLVYGAVAGAL